MTPFLPKPMKYTGKLLGRIRVAIAPLAPGIILTIPTPQGAATEEHGPRSPFSGYRRLLAVMRPITKNLRLPTCLAVAQFTGLPIHTTSPRA